VIKDLLQCGRYAVLVRHCGFWALMTQIPLRRAAGARGGRV